MTQEQMLDFALTTGGGLLMVCGVLITWLVNILRKSLSENTAAINKLNISLAKIEEWMLNREDKCKMSHDVINKEITELKGRRR